MLSNKGRKTIQTQKIHPIEWIVLCKTKMTKSTSQSREFNLVIGGRSAEVRTPGLMVPNQLQTVFDVIFPHLRGFPLGKPCFRNLLRTLFPPSPLPYMAYTVVIAINQPQKLHPVYDFYSHHHVNIQSSNLQPCVQKPHTVAFFFFNIQKLPRSKQRKRFEKSKRFCIYQGNMPAKHFSATSVCVKFLNVSQLSSLLSYIFPSVTNKG